MSRRTVAKGALWSTPVLSTAAAAPALAASAPTVACPAPAAFGVTGTISQSSELAGSGGYSSYFTISAGQWNVPGAKLSDGSTATGFYLNWGGNNSGTTSGGAVHMTGSDGKSYQGDLSTSTPVGRSPQTAGAGLAVNLGVQTAIPYSATTCQLTGGVRISCISIPFSVTYLVGLATDNKPVSNACGYFWNACFDVSGCFPFTMSSQSITAGQGLY